MFCDNVPGVSIAFERDYALSVFKRIANHVVYLEDIFPQLSAIEDEYMYFLDDYLVWYEQNTGISTSGRDKWRKLLFKDRDAFYQLLFDTYPDDISVKKLKKLQVAYRIDNPYLHVLRSAVVYPPILKWAISHYIQVWQGAYRGHSKLGFLAQKQSESDCELIIR